MPKENRNPPRSLVGPQGMTTLLGESNERFARVEEKLTRVEEQLARNEEKLDELIKLVTEVLTLVTPVEETEDKAKSKAKK